MAAAATITSARFVEALVKRGGSFIKSRRTWGWLP